MIGVYIIAVRWERESWGQREREKSREREGQREREGSKVREDLPGWRATSLHS